MATLAPAYAPRRPTETALYGIVRDNLETFLSWARETYARPLPRYVEQELRGYLCCGVFAHGFVHCRCDDCGHDLFVAFSCKQRGACPSCAGRRMANTAAHLVDRVLPDVPVRQYVLSLPFELRALAAFKPEVLRAMARLFVEAIFGLYRARASRWAQGRRVRRGHLRAAHRILSPFDRSPTALAVATIQLAEAMAESVATEVLFAHPAVSLLGLHIEDIEGLVKARKAATELVDNLR